VEQETKDVESDDDTDDDSQSGERSAKADNS
jgi:hypothetical protein